MVYVKQWYIVNNYCGNYLFGKLWVKRQLFIGYTSIFNFKTTYITEIYVLAKLTS